MSSTTPQTGSVPVQPRQRFCTDCGADAGHGRFCASCGAPLTAGPAATPVPSLPRNHQPAMPQHPYDSAPHGEFVQVASVARQTSEYVEVANLGVVKLASISQRVLARVLDIVLVAITDFAVVGIFGAIGSSLARTQVSSANFGSGLYGSDGASDAMAGAIGGGLGLIAGLFLMSVIAYFYELVMVTLWGRTVGKMLVGTRIIRASDGMKPNIGNAFLRWLAPGLGGLIPFLGPLGEALVLLSPTFDSSGRRQGWHDKMGGTLVIEAPRPPIARDALTKLTNYGHPDTATVRNPQAHVDE